MSDDQDKDSKTEDPTEKKMRDAAEKGNTPISREVPIFASALAFYLYLVFFLPSGMARMAETLRDLFEQPDQWTINSATDVVSLFTHLAWEAGALLLPAIALIMMFGVGSNVLQHMPSFVLEADQTAILACRSPRAGSACSASRGWSNWEIAVQDHHRLDHHGLRPEIGIFRHAQRDVLRPSGHSPPATIMKKIMVVILLATFVLAVVDFFWTRHHWYTQLRMTKQEIRTNTSSRRATRSSRPASAPSRATARRRMINVPRATLVITNPTHYAVALRYVREENEAPVVIAKGQDLVALKIRELARENDIPIFEDPPLARSMFAQVSVDSVIPSIFYKAVAELVHRVYAAKAQKRRVR